MVKEINDKWIGRNHMPALGIKHALIPLRWMRYVQFLNYMLSGNHNHISIDPQKENKVILIYNLIVKSYKVCLHARFYF